MSIIRVLEPKVYVGPWERKPAHVRRCSELDCLLPEEMPRIVAALTEDVWINNPYALDGMNPDRVMVLTPSGPKALTQHPDFQKWEFGVQTGELWVVLGNEW